MEESTISMAILHGYVKLPEGSNDITMRSQWENL